MSRFIGWLRAAANGIVDFVVGDDLVSAAGIIVIVTGTAVLPWFTHIGWWFLPVAVVALLVLSVYRVRRPRCASSAPEPSH